GFEHVGRTARFFHLTNKCGGAADCLLLIALPGAATELIPFRTTVFITLCRSGVPTLGGLPILQRFGALTGFEQCPTCPSFSGCIGVCACFGPIALGDEIIGNA